MPGFFRWRTSLDFPLTKHSNLYWEKKTLSSYRPIKVPSSKKSVSRWTGSDEIQFYTSENDDIKAAIVERFNWTIKTRMHRYFTHSQSYRYVNVLQALVHSSTTLIRAVLECHPALLMLKSSFDTNFFTNAWKNQNDVSTSANEWESVSESKHSRKVTCPDDRKRFASSARNFSLLLSLTRLRTWWMKR